MCRAGQAIRLQDGDVPTLDVNELSGLKRVQDSHNRFHGHGRHLGQFLSF
jgi:hypothetical protein